MLRVALVQTIPEGQAKPHVGMGIGYLQSYTLKHEPDVGIDLFLNDSEFRKGFDPLHYDVVGISSVSYGFDEAIEIARKVKETDARIPVIIGGSHITGFPRSIDCEYFDVGVVGEGEETFLALLRAIRKQGRPGPDILKEIPGVCYTVNGEVFQTGRRPYIRDLDSIPPVDKQFLKRYRAIPFTAISRGCPFNCTYCNSHMAWQSKVRMYSPEYVVKDILELRKAFPEDNRIIFREDTFTVHRKALESIRDHLDTIRGGREVSFIGSSHPNFVTPKMAELLRSIGVRKLNFGIESGSDRLMRIVKRNSTNVERVLEALRVARDHGIQIGSSFIIGFPEETEEDLRQSYEFIIEQMQKGLLFTTGTLILTPLPSEQSDYWKVAVERYGIDHRTFQWSRLDFRSWHLYYFENGQTGDIHEWWDWRCREKALYIGAIPPEKWLKIIEPYEIEMRRMNEVNIAIDRKS